MVFTAPISVAMTGKLHAMASSMTVGYTFPSYGKWVKRLRLSTPRIFITQNQLFHWGTIEMERGTSYPFARRFNFGLSTTF